MHLVVSLLLIESYYFLNLTPMPPVPLQRGRKGEDSMGEARWG